MRDLARGLRNFWRDPSGRSVLGIAATVIGTGALFYRFVEEMSWVDAFYFSVVTVSTVGYGDISPTTTAGKIFTMVYVVVGIGVFVALVSTTAHHILEAKQSRTE